MSLPPDFKTDPKRDATDSIRGYVYQAYQSILAWMQLKENEILVLEGSEDFDIHSGSSVSTTQVKDVSSNLTLKSQAVVDSLNNYWSCRDANPDFNIILRFLTTAEAGQEQGSPFGPDQKGLEYWRAAESDKIDIEPIRSFLLKLKLKLNPNLKSFIETATAGLFREKLIRSIKWDMGNRPREALQYIIEDRLKLHGLKLGINSHYSCQALPHLLKKIADLLSTKGTKELRFGDFLSFFDEATTLSIPRGKMEAMASGGALQQLAGMLDLAEISRVANIATTIGKPIPIVDGGISRTTVVQNLTKLLREQRVIFLCGSSGLGKTNLASLISQDVGGNWGWVGFRGMRPELIKDVLTRATFGMNEAQVSPFLVLDDVDLSQVTLFEREFISLIFSVINSNGMVIVTGPTGPPLQLLPKLWKKETCKVTVPYFDETEVAEMVRAHGLSDGKRVSAWVRAIWLATSGHPQLVHARVRNLSSKGWPSIELSDFIKPDDVERVRSEARSRLVKEIPTDDTRVLAYRLSLIIGAFSRETAIAVALSPPPMKLPGEAFDALIGPWVEKEGENRFRVTPLLTGAANNVLSDVDIKAVHSSIAENIISTKSIDQFETSTAFFHALMAKNIKVLTLLAGGIVTDSNTNFRPFYDTMGWFYFMGLDDGQKILPENLSIDLMLRLAQYRLIASSPEPDKAVIVIGRIEETLKEIDIPEVKIELEALAYGTVLNTLEVRITPSIVIRMLSRMVDLVDESPALKSICDTFENATPIDPRMEKNNPVQVLFSLQFARLSGLNDLTELVESLEALAPGKREQLLLVFDTCADFASLLVGQAWWKELKDDVLDVDKTLQVFDYTEMKAREWKVPELTKACLVAKSVIQDEYGHSTDRALDILDAADREFPNEARLLNQRAKVLFHANRELEALPIVCKALELPSLPDVEYIFSSRDAGMAAAKLDDWIEAERLFMLGAERDRSSRVQNNMGIGLMADAAFALWKQKKYKKSLLLLADTLDSLGKILLSDHIRIRHLHATVRHIITWIYVDTQGAELIDLVEPLPGMCSNQEPHEGFKDIQVVDISAAWELLAITEHTLGLDIGIKERAHVATGGKMPQVVEGFSRTVAFGAVFKNRDFDKLVPRLISMLAAMHHSIILEKGKGDEWSTGETPVLPDGYWEIQGNVDWIYHYMLVASVICTVDNKAVPLPTEHWRTDLENAGVLSNDIKRFISVLHGAPPEEALYQKAAAVLFSLRSMTLAPEDLWKGSFQLLNALERDKRWVETALEKLLVPHWIFAINNQRFAFSTPSLVCPAIEKCCLDKSCDGLAKIASILDITAPYLNIRLSSDAKQMIKRIIEKK